MSYEKEYEIGGEKIVLKPLTVDEGIDIVLEMSDDEKRQTAVRKLIVETLKKNGKTLKDFSMKQFTDLAEAVLDVNGLNKDKDGKQK